MGLDVVEIVLRTEETFSIALPDWQCERVVTVGDLYRLVLEKLELRYTPVELIETENTSELIGLDRSRGSRLSVAPVTWTASDVWVTLKALIQDELQISPDEVREDASFSRDLGAD